MEPSDDLDEWALQVAQARWMETRWFTALASTFGAGS